MANYQISNLIIKDPQNEFWGEVFINEEEINQKGSLLVLAEIESATNEAQEIISNFLQIAYSAYKQSIGNSSEQILEDILHQLNQKLSQLPQKEKNWFKNINAVVGLLHDNALHFSAVGNVNAFLIRQAQFTDLIKEKIESQSALKIFTTIISGNLDTNDAFLFTTPSLLDYISTDKIRKYINTLPPLSAVENLKNLVINTPPPVSFLSIIVKQRIVSKTKATPKIISYQGPEKSKISPSEQSINKLLEKQRETSNIIRTPTLGQTILVKIRSLFQKIHISRKQSSFFKLSLGILIISIVKFFKFIFLGLYRIITICLGLLSTKDKRQDTISLLNKNFAKTFNYLKDLSKVKKIIGILFLLVLLFLSQNLILTSRKQHKIESEEKYQTNLIEINNLQDTIEAALIYNDETRAEESLENLINLVNGLPTDSKDRIVKSDELKISVEILVQRVWKLVNITNPVELFSIDLTTDQSFPKILQYVNNQLILISDNKFWSSPINQVEITSEKIFDSTNFLDSTKQLNDDSFIVFSEDNKLLSWRNNALQEISIQLSPAFKKITGLGKFNNALYILDSQANQIYKHQPTGENYGPSIPWMKDHSYSLTNSISFAIDGSVYLLENNGQIQKFLAGKKQDFPEISVYPDLSSPKKIFTDQETNNLYILDPGNNRVIVVNKEGELINQYSSDKFDNLIDFIVLEQEKKIYLLNGNQVYVISIF